MSNNRRKRAAAQAAILVCSIAVAPLAIAQDEAAVQAEYTPLHVNFLGAANLPALGGIAVAGLHGMVGLLTLEDGAWHLRSLQNGPKEDFTALARLSDSEALVGSATGRIYRYDGDSLVELAKLSEYDEPVLDIVAVDGRAWAVGARGIVARSPDGKEWEIVTIRDVHQPLITWPSAQAADWYFGVSNVDRQSVRLHAAVGGEPAVADEHYVLFSDEGFLQISTDFDMDPAPTIEFNFQPGPPFRPTDVSWNVVLYDGNKLTLAGEFGMILQSTDEGETWIRRNTKLGDSEPRPAYWLAGVQQGDTLFLTGAAGVSSVSRDGGVTWSEQPRPGNEGIFGVTLLDNGNPLIAGAVGLIGRYDGSEWMVADRTQLKLLSWLKNPVLLADGTILMLGGRSTAVSFKDGQWTRMQVVVH